MKKKIISVLFLLVILNSIVGQEANIITNIRQLTFEGKRSGEGYFGPNGNLMVFQSERDPKNPFYQILKIDNKVVYKWVYNGCLLKHLLP